MIGSAAVIDPFDDMGYDKTVSISVDSGSFIDLAGVSFAGIGSGDFEVRTPSAEFQTLQGHNATHVLRRLLSTTPKRFRPREGAITHYVKSTLMLYAGRSEDNCLGDLWTSSSGSTWTVVAGVAGPRGAHAPTAVDSLDCVWLLGGECNTNPNILWKSCDIGRTWQAIGWPSVVPWGKFPWPQLPGTWSGHAIAVVGGWRLVIVDAASVTTGGVWRFVDSKGRRIQKVAYAPLPFGVRQDPSLLATSEGVLYLLGGHLRQQNMLQ